VKHTRKDRGNLVQRGDGVDRIESHRSSWHPIDHAACFVLRNSCGSGLLHGQHAFGPISSHAGEQKADGMSCGGLGDRGEEHIDRWPLKTDLGAVTQFDDIFVAPASQDQVEVAWSDECEAALHSVSVDSFANLHGAQLIEPCGEGL